MAMQSIMARLKPAWAPQLALNLAGVTPGGLDPPCGEGAEGVPYDRPGALPAEEYAAVLAYLLELNAYPAGDAPLEGDPDALRGIRIERAPEDDGG